MRQPSPTAPPPKKVSVNITAGTGVDIVWGDGHISHYSFPYLRDACPCAMCEEQRDQAGTKPGNAPKPAPGALPIFKETAKARGAEAVGKYALRFEWRDGHESGIYSWDFLREYCPCEECKSRRARP